MAANRNVIFIQDLSSDDFECLAGKLRIKFPAIPGETLTTLVVNGTTDGLTYTDENGTANNIALCPVVQNCETVTSVAYNSGTGVFTYTDEDGVANNINLPVENFLSAASYNDTTNILTLTLDDGTTFNVDLNDLVDTDVLTTLTDNANGTITYVDEVGGSTVIDICSVIGSCSINALSDVDTTTTAPADCDLLAWDATNSEWVPHNSSSTLNCAALTP